MPADLDLAVKRVLRFDSGNVKALCDVTVGEQFLIRGLRVVEGKNGVFVSMPRQQKKDGKWFDLVEPLNKDVKRSIQETVMAAYEKDDSEE